MTGIFWDNVLLFKGLYDQTLDPVAQRWNLTRMELDLLLFLHNNPTRNTAAEAVRLRRWTKSHVSAAIRDLKSKDLLSTSHPPDNRKVLRLTPLSAAAPILEQGLAAQQSFYNAILRDFTAEELQFLERLSEKIARNIRDTIQK